MRRETCLYCEQAGKSTALVEVGSWGCCPIHSADWIEAHKPPTFRSLLESSGMAPVLMDKGVASRGRS